MRNPIRLTLWIFASFSGVAAVAQDMPVPMPAANTPTPAPAAAQAASAQAKDDPDRTYRIGEINVGDHVMVDGSLMNQWRPCVLIQVKTMPYDSNMIRGFVVRCEDGTARDVSASPRMVKK